MTRRSMIGSIIARQSALAMMLWTSRTERRDSLSARMPAGTCEIMPPITDTTRKRAICDRSRPTAMAKIGPTEPKVAVDSPATMTPNAARGETR